jgi:hypothetical protein
MGEPMLAPLVDLSRVPLLFSIALFLSMMLFLLLVLFLSMVLAGWVRSSTEAVRPSKDLEANGLV